MSSTPNKFKKVVFFGIFLAFLLIIIGLVKSLVGFLGVEDRFLRVERDIEVLEREKTDIESKLILEEDDFVAEQQLRNSLGLSFMPIIAIITGLLLYSKKRYLGSHREC